MTMTTPARRTLFIDPAAPLPIHHDHFQIGNRRYRVVHAPDGGRKEMHGPVTDLPFCWASASGGVLSATPLDRGECPELWWGDVLIVKGYGQFHVERPRILDGDHPRLRRVGEDEALRMQDGRPRCGVCGDAHGFGPDDPPCPQLDNDEEVYDEYHCWVCDAVATPLYDEDGNIRGSSCPACSAAGR